MGTVDHAEIANAIEGLEQRGVGRGRERPQVEMALQFVAQLVIASATFAKRRHHGIVGQRGKKHFAIEAENEGRMDVVLRLRLYEICYAGHDGGMMASE